MIIVGDKAVYNNNRNTTNRLGIELTIQERVFLIKLMDAIREKSNPYFSDFWRNTLLFIAENVLPSNKESNEIEERFKRVGFRKD